MLLLQLHCTRVHGKLGYCEAPCAMRFSVREIHEIEFISVTFPQFPQKKSFSGTETRTDTDERRTTNKYQSVTERPTSRMNYGHVMLFSMQQ